MSHVWCNLLQTLDQRLPRQISKMSEDVASPSTLPGTERFCCNFAPKAEAFIHACCLEHLGHRRGERPLSGDAVYSTNHVDLWRSTIRSGSADGGFSMLRQDLSVAFAYCFGVWVGWHSPYNAMIPFPTPHGLKIVTTTCIDR